MSISAISGYTSIFESSDVNSLLARRRREEAAQDALAGNRNTGPDTAVFSDEALEKYAALKNGDTSSTNAAASGKSSSSLSGVRSNLFGMMLESLFLADLDEAQRASAASSETGESGDGAPQSAPERIGGRNPFSDTGKTAEIKKAMNDFASGKADIADLPKAMSLGGGSGVTTAPAQKKARSSSASALKDDGNGTV